MHPKIAVATDSDRIGSHGSDLLRHHSDIGLLAAIVREAVVAETVIEPAQQHDIVLEHDIRAAPATATAAAAAEASATSKAPAAVECGSPPPAAGEPAPAAIAARRRPEMPGSRSCAVRRPARRATRSHVPCRSGPVSDSLPVAGRPACARLPVRTGAVGDVSAVGAGPQALCGRAGAGRDPGPDPGPSIGVAEPLLQVRIVVARALSMRRIVSPCSTWAPRLTLMPPPAQLMRLPPQ